MPRKRSVKKSSSRPASAKAETTPGRAARGQVRGVLLASLASGPKTRKQLLALGGFSVPSFYLNLKQLKSEKLIVAGGRGGVIRLKAEAPAGDAAKAAKAAVPALRQVAPASLAVIPQFVSGELHDALEAVNARFAALDRIGEKLHTLEQLSRNLPAPVAEVLMSIHRDLMNLSPARLAD